MKQRKNLFNDLTDTIKNCNPSFNRVDVLRELIRRLNDSDFLIDAEIYDTTAINAAIETAKDEIASIEQLTNDLQAAYDVAALVDVLTDTQLRELDHMAQAVVNREGQLVAFELMHKQASADLDDLRDQVKGVIVDHDALEFSRIDSLCCALHTYGGSTVQSFAYCGSVQRLTRWIVLVGTWGKDCVVYAVDRNSSPMAALFGEC